LAASTAAATTASSLAGAEEGYPDVAQEAVSCCDGQDFMIIVLGIAPAAAAAESFAHGATTRAAAGATAACS
jgi:hypothetical protein